MKLFKVNHILGNMTLRLYKRKLLTLIENYDVHGAFEKCEVAVDDMKLAVDSIYLSGGYICMPDNCRSSYILRLLEYGGPTIKALNLLTLSSVKLGGSYDK